MGEESDEWTFEIECTPSEVFIFHGDQLHGPDFRSTDDKVAFALRQVCHFLVSQIDNKGLEEVYKSLAEFYIYYRPTDSSPRLPEVHTKRAGIATRTTSPAFVIAEE